MIVAVTGPDDVVPEPGGERVVSGAAEDPVGAVSAVDGVVVRTRVGDVAAAARAHLVVTREGEHEIAVVCPDEHVRELACHAYLLGACSPPR